MFYIYVLREFICLVKFFMVLKDMEGVLFVVFYSRRNKVGRKIFMMVESIDRVVVF